jgi:hypothetical protein
MANRACRLSIYAGALLTAFASLASQAQTPSAPPSLCVNGVCAAATKAGAGMKWHPGMGMFSGVFTTLGNKDNNLNAAASEKSTEISTLRAGPAAATTWLGVYFWRALNNSKGLIDGSATGSGLDADYAQVTGYTSGNGPAGTAVYNAPRRMAMMIFTQDYWTANPITRTVPDWVASSSAYGPVGPDGQHYGYYTAQGANGAGSSAFVAMWRPSVAGAYQQFMSQLANHVLPDGYTVDTSPYIEYIVAYIEISDQPQNSGGAVGSAADSTFASEGAFYSQIESMTTAITTSFPHTMVMINNNYSSVGSDAISLANYMASHGIAFGSGDTFGLSSGTNIGQCLCGETFGQLLYRSMLPPSGNLYTTQWLTGGTNYRSTVPMIGMAANTEMIQSYGAYYTPVDIFNQAQFVGFTHLDFQYVQGMSGTDAGGHNMATANWLGTASSITQWNTSPGKWNGALDAIYNNKLSNTGCPSAYSAAGCNPN